MKRLINYGLTLLLAILSTTVSAAGVQYLVFSNAGEETVIALADKPVITLSEGTVRVTVAGEERVSASLSSGITYTFSETLPTSIQQLQGDAAPQVMMGHVYIANAQKGETIRVFQADGKLAAAIRVSDDGTADVDLTALPKGLYIVKSPKVSIKIINK